MCVILPEEEITMWLANGVHYLVPVHDVLAEL